MVENDKPTKTGDDTKILLFVLVMFASGIGILLLKNKNSIEKKEN